MKLSHHSISVESGEFPGAAARTWPTGASFASAAVLAVVLGSWAVLYVVWHAWWVGPIVAALCAGALVGFGRARAAARSVAVLWALLALAVSSGLLWQLAMPVTIALWLGIARRWPSLAPTRGWYARGRVPLPATLAVGFVTPLAVGLWWVLLHPNLADVVATYLPPVPLPILVLGGVVFVVVNATGEELIFRGLLLDRLGAVWKNPGLPVLVQAALFGVCHAYGVPRGAWGALMAGVWAVMLGWLRRRSGGLLAPILAHVVADTAVALVVYAASGRR